MDKNAINLSAAAVQPFMKDFSPIIDIVKDFGAPYGGIALGTVSLLFAVKIRLQLFV